VFEARFEKRFRARVDPSSSDRRPRSGAAQ
jgi:hypothetical protein